MHTHETGKTDSRAIANVISPEQKAPGTIQYAVDNRPEAKYHKTLQEMANNAVKRHAPPIPPPQNNSGVSVLQGVFFLGKKKFSTLEEIRADKKAYKAYSELVNNIKDEEGANELKSKLTDPKKSYDLSKEDTPEITDVNSSEGQSENDNTAGNGSKKMINSAQDDDQQQEGAGGGARGVSLYGQSANDNSTSNDSQEMEGTGKGDDTVQTDTEDEASAANWKPKKLRIAIINSALRHSGLSFKNGFIINVINLEDEIVKNSPYEVKFAKYGDIDIGPSSDNRDSFIKYQVVQNNEKVCSVVCFHAGPGSLAHAARSPQPTGNYTYTGIFRLQNGSYIRTSS